MSLERYRVKPVRGLVFEAYMSRKDIGSGIRMFMVWKVGRKFVYLFYSPRCMSIRLTHKDWDELYMTPLHVDQFNTFNWHKSLLEMQRLGRKCGSRSLIERVLALTPTLGYELFYAALPGSDFFKEIT